MPAGLAATVAGPLEGVKKLLELNLFRNPDDPPEPLEEPKEREKALGCCLDAVSDDLGITCGFEDVGIDFPPDAVRGKKAGSSSVTSRDPTPACPVCTASGMGGIGDSGRIGRSFGRDDDSEEAPEGMAGLGVDLVTGSSDSRTTVNAEKSIVLGGCPVVVASRFCRLSVSLSC
jgi:hypothetical protein